MVNNKFYTEEQDKWRLAFLRVMLAVAVVLLLTLIGFRRFETSLMESADAVLFGMSVIFALQLFYVRRRYRFSAGLIFIVISFCSLCYLSWVGKGVHDSSVFAYLALILVASLLFDIQFAAVVLAATLVWLWVLALLQTNEILVYTTTDSPLSYVRDLSIAFLIVAGLGNFYLRQVNLFTARISNELLERTKAEAALRESEENYRSLFEKAAEGILIGTANGEILLSNMALEKLSGYSKSELKAKNIEFLFSEDNLNMDMLQYGKLPVNQVDIREQIICRKDGSNVMVDVISKKLSDGRLQVLITDITERVKARKSAEDFERIFTLSTNPICISKENGTLVKINPALARSLGYEEQEIEGRKIYEFVHPDDFQRVTDYIDKEIEKQTEIITIENRYLTKSGEIKWFSSSTQTNYVEHLGFTIAYDITELKKVEAELIEAKEKAEQSDELKSSFLANMSHEVRTPMNGIIGFSEMIMSSDTAEEERIHYAKIIHNNGVKLLTLLDDIINISRIETGALELNFEAVNINKLLEEIYEFYLSRAHEKNLDYEIVKELSDTEATIITDRTRVHQIISNLLTNALKFTKQGAVNFGYEQTNGMITFFVHDTGIGISRKSTELIFERFRQADPSVTTEFGGTGLGLSISSKLVELLGGKIWLESKEGKGSSFFFTIPYKRDGIEASQDKLESSGHSRLLSGKKLILIVEDDASNREYIDRLFKKEGFNTVHAVNGLESIELVKSNSSISLVFMDIKMPVMNGYDATRAIKSIRPELPVIAQTAFAMQSDREKAIQAGCDAYVTKPLVKEVLIEVLLEHLEKK